MQFLAELTTDQFLDILFEVLKLNVQPSKEANKYVFVTKLKL